MSGTGKCMRSWHQYRLRTFPSPLLLLGLWLATCAGALLTGAMLDVPAQGAETPPSVAIRRNTIELPNVEIAPNGKTAFTVHATEQSLKAEVLLRFEAVIPFAKEAGYASSARIAVNGVALDDSHFPVNWAERRAWSIPAVRREPLPLYTPGSKTWTVRYDCDRWPPAEGSFYYSPEMASRYVYMFPIAGLLEAGENRLEIENTSGKYTLQLLSCELGDAADKPGISSVRSLRATDTSIELAWDSDRQRQEIDYRPRGQTEWQTVLNVHSWENPYTLIMLEPGTTYQCRVRGLPQRVADLEGKVAPSEAIESSVIEVETKREAEIGDFAGFRLYPTRHVPGGLTTYPCIESHDGLLWLVDGSLHLIKLDPEGGKLVFRREQPLAG